MAAAIGLVVLSGLAVVSFTEDRTEREAKVWAVEETTRRYVLVKTKEFNGLEWKTYRDTETNRLFLLSPNGSWIPVERP